MNARPGCRPCAAMRNAIPMPERARRALEDFEKRRLERKAQKRALKERP